LPIVSPPADDSSTLGYPFQDSLHMLRDILPPLKGVGFLIHPPDSVSSCEGYGGLDVQRRVFGRAPPYGSDIS